MAGHLSRPTIASMFDGSTPLKKRRQWIAGTAFGPTGYDGKQNP
jgi:hypothetical protein